MNTQLEDLFTAALRVVRSNNRDKVAIITVQLISRAGNLAPVIIALNENECGPIGIAEEANILTIVRATKTGVELARYDLADWQYCQTIKFITIKEEASNVHN